VGGWRRLDESLLLIFGEGNQIVGTHRCQQVAQPVVEVDGAHPWVTTEQLLGHDLRLVGMLANGAVLHEDLPVAAEHADEEHLGTCAGSRVWVRKEVVDEVGQLPACQIVVHTATILLSVGGRRLCEESECHEDVGHLRWVLLQVHSNGNVVPVRLLELLVIVGRVDARDSVADEHARAIANILLVVVEQTTNDVATDHLIESDEFSHGSIVADPSRNEELPHTSEEHTQLVEVVVASLLQCLHHLLSEEGRQQLLKDGSHSNTNDSTVLAGSNENRGKKSGQLHLLVVVHPRRC